MHLPRLLKSKLRALPDKPGCYLMRDASGKIIYVGKAASLRKRVLSYFRKATLRSAPPKIRSLVHSTADLDIIIARKEADALLTENKLIKEYQPYFNVLLRDDKRFLLLSVNLNETWPRFRLCRIRRDDGALYFGPYLSSAAARTALEFVEKKFGLRKCAPSVPDKKTHRHCINDIVRFCSAPCLGKISPAAYRKQVDEALAFLRGERPVLLNELRVCMDQAAARLDFEKAAVIRDALHLLFSAVKQRARVVRTNGVSSKNALAGLNALQQTLGLRRRPGFIQAVDISNISGKHAVGSMVAAVNGICRPALYRRFRITTRESADDAAMTAEVVFRHFKRLMEEKKRMPDLLLVDGGIVQLRAAQSTLRQLGIADIAVAGLAKKLEQIYSPSPAGPSASQGARLGLRRNSAWLHLDAMRTIRRIVLPNDSPALQVLQRLRDEAHRFALSYHHRLRAKLIRESVLDDIAGLGGRRKEKLLRRFGSVRAIARADENKIALCAGIGPALAHKIKACVNRRE